MCVYCYIEARSCSHCCSGKTISITYSQCVFVALRIEHAMCMRHIVILACPALLYFSTLSHKRHGFLSNVIKYTIGIIIFSTNFFPKIFSF